ncbi:MAG: glucose-6-phosphate isomerase [Marinilabiliaceae bacterium]|jgi:glucose-6-phosphate isomerase|nr:glucose-6-phosphate isomerase [Marinilabiliaceae bacterium]
MWIDYSNCLKFVSEKEIAHGQKNAKTQLEHLLSGKGKGNDFLGWITLPEDSALLTARINKTAERLRSQAAISVVVGIGGSYLGSKAVIEALSDPFAKAQHQVLFAGHHLSESYHSKLISLLEGKAFNIIVISKSGTTTEPALAFRLLKDLLTENLGKNNISSHIVAITDSSRGALREMADREGYESYIIPDNIGGRYSVLTPVGLLPVATAGFNINSLIEGAAEIAAVTRDNNNPLTNPALSYAALRNILLQKGYSVEMLVNYEPGLHYLAEWWKQLFGESEGKDGKGIFPASASLTTDLHSLGQYIQDGQRFIFETVLSVNNTDEKVLIPFDQADTDKLNYIAGKSLSEVNKKAEEGTIMAHVDGGVPVIRIELRELKEHAIGELMYFFEISCAVSGYVLGVNPFDQPGVEAYKTNMFRLLGKEGY